MQRNGLKKTEDDKVFIENINFNSKNAKDNLNLKKPMAEEGIKYND